MGGKQIIEKRLYMVYEYSLEVFIHFFLQTSYKLLIKKGEEIGMVDVWISWKNTVDTSACNTNSSFYETVTRDPERTPFQWDDTVSAGFSTNQSTWLPVAANYKEVNVKKELASPRSHLKCYQDLMALKKHKTLKFGSVKAEAVNKNVLAILRLNKYC